MASAAIKSHVSPEEYLALERKAEFKSEYFDGCIYAMAGASAEHGFLALDLATVLNAQLRAGPCEVFGSDMCVLTHRSGLYTYPDLLASGWLGSVPRCSTQVASFFVDWVSVEFPAGNLCLKSMKSQHD
jgi:Uma2 family endonuclease